MLTKTGIEYGELAWNFYVGCKHDASVCPVTAHCWAAGMARRQKQNFREPRLIPERLLDPLRRKKPARILVNFMGDLFGEWTQPDAEVNPSDEGPIPAGKTLKDVVLTVVESSPQHTFLFLTKAPENIWKVAWPVNAWMGATAWDSDSFDRQMRAMRNVKAKHKWLSLEPLLDWTGTHGLQYPLAVFDWVVIGAQTRPDVMPKIEWVREIVEACDAAGVKVWLKNNLRPLLDQTTDGCFRNHGGGLELRQDLPRQDRERIDRADAIVYDGDV